MKKITMLFAVALLSISSLAFSQEGLVKVDDAYVILKDGTKVTGDFNHFCFVLIEEAFQSNPNRRVIEANIAGLKGRDGDGARQAICSSRTEMYRLVGGVWDWYPVNDGRPSSSSPWGPIRCDVGGVYGGFALGCWKYPDQQ